MSLTKGWTRTEKYSIAILACFLLLVIGIIAQNFPISLIFGLSLFLVSFLAYDDLNNKNRRTKPPFELEPNPLNLTQSLEVSNLPSPTSETPESPLESENIAPDFAYMSKIEKANLMREKPEPAEKKMLEILNSSVSPHFPEHPFYFQNLQCGYILDFYCPTLKLAIEVDGSSHDNKRGYDWERQTHLEQRGIQVLRASNNEVFSNPQGLADSLCKIIQEKNEQLEEKKRYSAMRNNRARYSPRRY